MPTRETLGVVYDELAAVWPSLAPDARRGPLIRLIAEDTRGFTDEELRAGARLLRASRGKDGAVLKFPPTLPAELVTCCATAAKRLRQDAIVASKEPPDWYCPHCKTRRLRTITHQVGAHQRSRMVPDCEFDCAMRDRWWPAPVAWDVQRAIAAKLAKDKHRPAPTQPAAEHISAATSGHERGAR